MSFLFKTKLRSFLTTSALSLSSYAAYDKFEYQRILNELKSKASIIANQPMSVNEIPRKVIIYITPSQYATHVFERFVKPVLDAGALDYDIIDAKQDYAEHIKEYIWKGKEEAMKRPSHIRKQRTWKEYFFGTVEPQVMSGIYDPEVGIVCVGEDVFGKVCTGIEQGCFTNKPPPKMVAVEVQEGILPETENKSNANADTASGGTVMEVHSKQESKNVENIIVEQLSCSNLPLSTPTGLPLRTYNTFDLFPLGFIHGKNLIGFKFFFERVFMWFHERINLENLGMEALAIVLDEPIDIPAIECKEEAFLKLPEEIKSRIRVYN